MGEQFLLLLEDINFIIILFFLYIEDFRQTTLPKYEEYLL